MHICNNEFVHGIIDKAQFGKYGLVHIVHELYGADTAGSLLSIFSRLFTNFLQVSCYSYFEICFHYVCGFEFQPSYWLELLFLFEICFYCVCSFEFQPKQLVEMST